MVKIIVMTRSSVYPLRDIHPCCSVFEFTLFSFALFGIIKGFLQSCFTMQFNSTEIQWQLFFASEEPEFSVGRGVSTRHHSSCKVQLHAVHLINRCMVNSHGRPSPESNASCVSQQIHCACSGKAGNQDHLNLPVLSRVDQQTSLGYRTQQVIFDYMIT